ncbi:S-methyl-5-thioribose-1-phosphate isomerase [Acidithiobacillus sp.]
MSKADSVRAIRWEAGQLLLLDQRRLPQEELILHLEDYREVVAAIRNMVVRGAPAIGVTAAYAMALAAREVAPYPDWRERLRGAAEQIKAARPTAVNLAWAVDRQWALAEQMGAGADVATIMLQAAHDLLEGDIVANRQMGALGAPLMPDGGVLTHCNTGSLATGGFGTALGVIRAAVAAGTALRVYADETRPWLQGARLTAWELQKDGIPFSLNVDGAAAALMQQGLIQAVIVGADRIAANGDTANKIGTYGLAVLAHYHGIPFYVAAPLSTVDFAMADGAGIVIEERPPEEVTHCAGLAVAPAGVQVRNPAFDVTPAVLISAIITERGVARPSFVASLRELQGA